MKIIDIEVFPIKIKKDYVYLGESNSIRDDEDYYIREEYRCCYSKNMETLLVKVTTDNGLVGWGEALSPVVPEVAGTVIEKLFKPFLIGMDPTNIEVIKDFLYDLMRERGYYSGFMVDAITAVDISLYDIIGKFYNVPIYKLLGGKRIDRIPAYVSNIPVKGLDNIVEEAIKWKEKGFTAIKMQGGHGKEKDMEVFTRLREALGSDYKLMVDMHWEYDTKEAISVAKELEKIDIDFIECPVLPEFIGEVGKISNKVNCKVALGEADRTIYRFKDILDKNAADIIQPDVGRTGITELKRIATIAESYGKTVAPHLSVGLAPCIAATLHLCVNLGNFYGYQEYQHTILPIANELLREPIKLVEGAFVLPKGNGLGIEINEDVVRKYCVK